MSLSPSAPAPRRWNPLIFTALIAPFGAVAGFSTVALAFLCTRRGLTVQQGAELIALATAPHVWKVFWAPAADTTLSRRRWYLLASLLCAAGVFALSVIPLGPATFRKIEAIVLLTSIASTFLGFAAEALIAHLVLPEDRGRISGWYQAGNLGGGGFGGGLGLWLLEKFPSGGPAGLGMAAFVLACAMAVFLLPDIAAAKRERSVLGEAAAVGKELRRLFSSRLALLSALLCLLPVGTGAASGVLSQSSVAAHWGAGAGAVELVQGFLFGLVAMAGCLAGGYACSRHSPRACYAAFGGILAATDVTMALLPAVPAVYIGGSLVYAFASGLCFAAFSALVFDIIGTGLAATKYNGFASLANTPIWYMGLFLAAIETRLGATGMLWGEAACGCVSIGVFLTLGKLWKPSRA